MVNLSEIYLGRMRQKYSDNPTIDSRVVRAKVQFAVWVQKYGLVNNVFYRREKSDGVNGEM